MTRRELLLQELVKGSDTVKTPRLARIIRTSPHWVGGELGRLSKLGCVKKLGHNRWEVNKVKVNELLDKIWEETRRKYNEAGT